MIVRIKNTMRKTETTMKTFLIFNLVLLYLGRI